MQRQGTRLLYPGLGFVCIAASANAPCLLQAFVLPAIAALPPYKTWIHVKNNVLSREIGKRMFYTGVSEANLEEPGSALARTTASARDSFSLHLHLLALGGPCPC